MTTRPKMTLKERKTYLSIMQIRYRQAKGRKEKSELLDEMVSTTGMNRDYLIHKIGHPIRRQTRSRERGKTYGPDVDAALSKIAQAQHHICAERLAGYLMETAENLANHGELLLDPHLREQLQRISVSTIRRHLKALPETPRRPAQHAAPNTLRAQQQAIDLFALHDQILAKFQHLFAYPATNLDKPENVFETLAHPELFSAAFAALEVVPASALAQFQLLPVPVST